MWLQENEVIYCIYGGEAGTREKGHIREDEASEEPGGVAINGEEYHAPGELH